MRQVILPLLCLLASPAFADMYQDGSNATPAARGNLGALPSVSATKDLGFVGDGATVNTAAITALFARTDSPAVYFPAGTYLVPCPMTTLYAASALSIVGESKTATKWIYPPSCTGTTGAYSWNNASNWRIEDITFDFNNAASSSPTTTQWLMFNVTGTLSKSENWRVSNVNFINAGASMTPFGVSGHILGTKGWSFDHNLVHQTAPNTLAQGGGIQINESGAVNENVKIADNVFKNIGMSVQSRNSIISGNEVSGIASGNGIVLVGGDYATGNVVSNNNIHDGAVTRDVYTTSSGGIESHSHYTLITGNLFMRNGGGAIINFGKNATISDNAAIDNARRDDAGPDAAYSNAYVSVDANGDGAVFSNNTAIDTGATQFAYLTGTLTVGDQLKLTFTGADITGSPVTVTYTTASGNTLAAMAAGLAAQVNGNANLTAAKINATSVVAPNGSGVVTINQPPTLKAAITSSVVGATEFITIFGAQRYCYAEPNVTVAGSATVYMGKCTFGKGGAMVRNPNIQPGTRIVAPPGERATVATLPACDAVAKYMTFSVTDQLGVPTYRGALTGGGALAVLAYCNGTSWEAH